MKKKLAITGISLCVLLVIAGVAAFAVLHGRNGGKLVLDGELPPDSTVEYTGAGIQLPMAHIENSKGEIISYDVAYEVIDLKNNTSVEDKYADFDLKVGDYKIIYTYAKDKRISSEISFFVRDTTAPVIEFLEIPNGLFLQDISEDEALRLPAYTVDDVSANDGMDVKAVLYFQGENDQDYKEYSYKALNNSYTVKEFGKFKFKLTATDIYGNTESQTVEWKIKDRDWKPSEMPADGYLADYSVEGYTNLMEGGDANQYYIIGNDYKDEWLSEYQGADGVLKVEMGFNNAAGYGNNTIKLYFARSFTKKDLEGKYLAVRIYVEGDNLKDTFLFGGNNVAFREEDSTTRAFTIMVDGLETGKWKTYYIDAATVEHIGMYPNAAYNSQTTFYEGGDPATCLQLCFSRMAGYYNNMTLYVDSITIADKLPETEITIHGNEANWKAIDGAVGYKVNLNGKETIITETKITLDGKKGYIRVTPLGDGALTLDGEEITAVYGIDAGDKLAAFDDELYIPLFSDKLNFSTAAEHAGYKPVSMKGTYTEEGVTLEIGTGAWGVVTGTRLQFPQAKAKGDNTTLVLNMAVSDAKYSQIRVYDYDGVMLSTIKLTAENTGKYCEFEVDLSGYDKVMKGIQLVFGPNKTFISVPEGVTVKFKEIYYTNTYYDITVNGQTLICAGERVLETHYTTDSLVQFRSVFNFGVPADNTPLSFEGTILLDGKELRGSEYSVVGYPDTDTICFNVAHNGGVLTIMKGSIIYYGGKAVIVGETFNAKWNGTKWIAVSGIPDRPADEYITIDGSQKLVENKTALKPGYTQENLVQFINVNDFGVTADDTPLSFAGTVLLDGIKVQKVNFVGYKDNTTICLKVPHNGKILTILKDSVVYYGDKAVIVTETFNAEWVNGQWQAVSEIPVPPEKEYITVDGAQKEVVGKVELSAGYTADTLVQFTNVYDFGVEDNGILSFSGTILLDGKEATDYQFIGYKNNTTICLNNIAHKDKVLTILKDSVIYYGDMAVVITETFNARWTGQWIPVAEIPEPEPDPEPEPEPETKELSFAYRWGTNNLIQINTNLPADTPLVSFLATDNGCSIDQSGNQYQQVGWIGMADADGTIVLTFYFNAAFTSGQTYVLPKGAVFGFTDGKKYTLDKDYTFTFNGTDWTMAAEEEPSATRLIRMMPLLLSVLIGLYRF